MQEIDLEGFLAAGKEFELGGLAQEEEKGFNVKIAEEEKEKVLMMKRNQVNFLKSLQIFPVLFVLFSFPRDFRPCSLRQEGGRGRSGYSGKPRRRQDHCGGGHRECPPSSTDQLNIL